tara:strand:+ start:268 stop:1296 length:1029 start_codon:yes stop_codon:yes gene_type:complete
MKRLNLYYLFIFSFLSLSFSQEESSPDIVTKVATCAANWLKLETGTRAIGMGGAYTAVGNGISGVPYNPASIAFIENQQVFLSQTQYVADITYNVLGYGRNLSGTDFVGLHIFALDSGAMDRTTEDEPDGTGEQFKVTGICIRGTYARRITDRLRIGFTGKFIREDIYTAYMQTFAFDIGSNFNTGIYGFVLGMSVTNLGPEAKYGGEGLEIELTEEWTQNGNLSKITEPFPLPMTFRLGFMNEIIGPDSEFIKNRNHRLLVAMDGINSRDFTLYGTVGVEYSWKDIAYVRFGNRLGHDTAKWSVGGGFNIDTGSLSVGLDYAYVNYSILNFTHQFGLNFGF